MEFPSILLLLLFHICPHIDNHLCSDYLKEKTKKSNETKKIQSKNKQIQRKQTQKMVSNMNIEPRAEICDTNRPTLTNSAISQNSIECHLNLQNNQNNMVDAEELTKKVLKLDLSQRSDMEKGSFDSDEKCSSAKLTECKSPKSPSANICEYPSFY